MRIGHQLEGCHPERAPRRRSRSCTHLAFMTCIYDMHACPYGHTAYAVHGVPQLLCKGPVHTALPAGRSPAVPQG